MLCRLTNVGISRMIFMALLSLPCYIFSKLWHYIQSKSWEMPDMLITSSNNLGLKYVWETSNGLRFE